MNGTAMRAGQRSATEADEMTMKEAMRSLSFAYLAVAIEERFFSVSDSLHFYVPLHSCCLGLLEVAWLTELLLQLAEFFDFGRLWSLSFLGFGCFGMRE